VIADAAVEIRKPQWQGSIDVLQVDLYDHEAAAPVLDSEAFYADCFALLTDDGAMTVNLFGRASSYERSLEKIVAVFGAPAVWAFKPTREGNTVVLAQRAFSRPRRDALAERAQSIQTRWSLPAPKWLRVFKPDLP
jgi:spermidine synthase